MFAFSITRCIVHGFVNVITENVHVCSQKHGCSTLYPLNVVVGVFVGVGVVWW